MSEHQHIYELCRQTDDGEDIFTITAYLEYDVPDMSVGYIGGFDIYFAEDENGKEVKLTPKEIENIIEDFTKKNSEI